MTKKPAPTLAPDALDFAPGLLAIQESPPAKLPRAVLLLVTALFVILVLWAVFGKLDIIASAEGRLVPQTYVKIVQPAEAGIVSEILVREAQAVAAGQVLMRMDTQIANADAAQVGNELKLKTLQLRRIDAELANRPLLHRTGEATELFAQIEAQWRAHRQSYDDAVAQEREALNKARHDLNSARETQSKLSQVVPSYRKSAQAYDKLSRDGYVSPLAAQEKDRDRIEKEQDLKAQEANVASLMATIAASERKLSQITTHYRSQLQNERVDTQSQVQKLTQDLVKVEHKASFLELRAPQAGIIKDLATHTRGTVVSPGTILMTLVPQDEPLQAEVQVKNEDVGFVHPGQQVKVKLSAYPFQKYGMLAGQVLHVGADASDARAPAPDKANEAAGGSAVLNYKALIRLGAQTLAAEGGGLRLTPGMQVIVEIHQGRRTVLEYLLSPIQKAFYDSARER